MVALTTEQIETARRASIGSELDRRGYQLRRFGASLVGPCPCCGGTDRFAVDTRKNVWNCRHCKPTTLSGDVIGFVQWIDGLSFRSAIEFLTGERGLPLQSERRPEPIIRSEIDKVERRAAEVLPIFFEESRPLYGTFAELYLRSRGADLAECPQLDHALRFNPSCPWDMGRRPCLVALWTDAKTGEPRAIHRRPITPNGRKIDVWKALGPTAGCVIRLWPDEEVSQGLVIGEGIETSLIAGTRVQHNGTLLRPAWAAGDKGHLAKFPLLSGIEALTILVDNDTNDAGQLAAAECRDRWISGGREVIRLTPRIPGADFADVAGKAA
jgi:phage/plasmid primase-like uncharacterized protein